MEDVHDSVENLHSWTDLAKAAGFMVQLAYEFQHLTAELKLDFTIMGTSLEHGVENDDTPARKPSEEPPLPPYSQANHNVDDWTALGSIIEQFIEAVNEFLEAQLDLHIDSTAVGTLRMHGLDIDGAWPFDFGYRSAITAGMDGRTLVPWWHAARQTAGQSQSAAGPSATVGPSAAAGPSPAEQFTVDPSTTVLSMVGGPVKGPTIVGSSTSAVTTSSAASQVPEYDEDSEVEETPPPYHANKRRRRT
ncbi:hypothetical protein CF319_g4407 [Tilletia indica]|uniref:Uncharacterized protein n=1 Tax=Tilletia indica TaxID=43049 RepID=A0A177T446_9BASI|nr:hypothetical protein CF319_g4407 [Tilletia indica]KAE8241800.1 hypothetical protein A4X13_0g7258 [Tilletia indica]